MESVIDMAWNPHRRVCHVFGRRLYRALGVEHFRHRRLGSEGGVFQRLLSLDFLLERPELPWLVTEQEKVEGGPLCGARDQACYPPAARLRRGRRALTAPSSRPSLELTSCASWACGSLALKT